MIVTHRRPDAQHTLRALQAAGSKLPVVLVVDDLDPTIDDLESRHPGQVRVFSKAAYAARVDAAWQPTGRSVLEARAAVWDLAAAEGWSHFVMLDDDYRRFFVAATSNVGRAEFVIESGLDRIFSAMFRILDMAPSVDLVAIAQTGDFYGKPIDVGFRKVMNAYACRTDRRVDFLGELNDDVNMYLTRGARGRVLITHPGALVQQGLTQQFKGGLTELYLDTGTYQKSMISVVVAPSCVKVRTLVGHGGGEGRPHHKINWHAAVPKIIRERWRKA
jgi:hypothetical protein